MKHYLKKGVFLVGMLAGVELQAQIPNGSLPPALSAIRLQDLRGDLFFFASDAMRGRRAGTIDELKGASWIAEQAQKAGLQPAGDNGTYFQFFPVQRVMVDQNSQLVI